MTRSRSLLPAAIGALIVIVNLLVDITHSFIDPRGSR